MAAAMAGFAAFAQEIEEKPVFAFDAGADFRMRQEIMHNVPVAEGGVLGRPGAMRGKTKNQMRFRPRVWAELKAGDNWRLYTRLADEFRAGIVQKTHSATFPGEVVLDNLFIEGKGLFDDFFDIRAGRQDLLYLYGLDHIFVDGTPGDGSRSTYADMVNMTFHADEESTLDLFALYNKDQEELRWGTKRSRKTSLTGFGTGEREMDDWGFGAVWSSRVDLLKYQVFAIQKNTASFHRNGVKHPRKQTNLVGTKLVPQWTESFSTPLEIMGQIGKNGDGDTLKAYAGYAGVDWRGEALHNNGWKPFFTLGTLVMSGDKHAAEEDGGNDAWDPMWYRGIDDSEMFLYGSQYGVAWWSNQINIKSTFGVDIAPKHRIRFMTGPMFAETKDGIGGGDGRYKGFLAQGRYDFPIWIADKEKGGRFELFGHFLVEYFAPGDYFDTDKPAYFFRWQIDFKF